MTLMTRQGSAVPGHLVVFDMVRMSVEETAMLAYCDLRLVMVDGGRDEVK